jgi:hypothetical protein
MSEGIQEHLPGIEPVAADGIRRPVDPVSVERRSAEIPLRHAAVPDQTAFVEDGVQSIAVNRPGWIALAVEQQLDAGGVA